MKKEHFNYRTVIRTIWKSVSGNLDSSDGKYFDEAINKKIHDEHQIKYLERNQILITLVIKNLNTTIQKFQIDEETFYHDIQEIKRTIVDFAYDLAHYEAVVNSHELCAPMMAS